jgi:hypothetical protein
VALGVAEGTFEKWRFSIANAITGKQQSRYNRIMGGFQLLHFFKSYANSAELSLCICGPPSFDSRHLLEKVKYESMVEVLRSGGRRIWAYVCILALMIQSDRRLRRHAGF